MILVWMGVFLMVWFAMQPNRRNSLSNEAATPRAVTPRADLTAQENSTINVFREASPSVVFVTSTGVARDFFSLNIFEIPRGSGSGFIYDTDGHIVTNVHVIAEGSRWTVTLADHSEWEASLVGAAEEKDLAVLKIGAPRDLLKPITVGTSGDLQVGQAVYAIGNPFGFDQTLTTGVVSALGRSIQSLTGRPINDVIQTDAAINPGNSGGPLLDSAGRLIGVNTQIASPSGGSAGIGFAIPVDIVNRVVPELIKYGRIIRPGLGVRLNDYYAQRLGLPPLLVWEVTRDGSAAKAGIRGTKITRSLHIRELGDVILRIGEDTVRNNNELLDALEKHRIGDEVDVTVLRNNREKTLRVTLQSVDAR